MIVPLAMAPRDQPAPAARVGARRSRSPRCAAVSVIVFAPTETPSLTFAPLPLLVWAALRFDLRMVAWELAGFGVLRDAP